MKHLTTSCLMLATLGSVAACTTSVKQAEVRPVQIGTTGGGSAAARGRELFARGEYALALEAFRREAREHPDSAEGYNGIAAAYDMIGRYDLSERYYQMALAHAPMDGRIYRNMARSLTMQGRQGEGQALLAEWDAINAGKMVVATVPTINGATALPEMASAPTPSAPASLPPAPESTSVVDLQSKPQTFAQLTTSPIPVVPIEPVKVAAAPVPVKAPASVAEVLAKPVLSVTTAPTAPRARVVAAVPVKVVVTGSVKPAKAVPVKVVTPVITARPTPAPVVRQIAQLAARPVISQRPSPTSLAPIRTSASMMQVRLVNAAGETGLARRMQQHLAQSGVTRSQLGNASRRYRLSWVVYPAGHRAQAMNVQKSLPFATRLVEERRAKRIIVVLGANARMAGVAVTKSRRG